MKVAPIKEDHAQKTMVAMVTSKNLYNFEELSLLNKKTFFNYVLIFW